MNIDTENMMETTGGPDTALNTENTDTVMHDNTQEETVRCGTETQQTLTAEAPQNAAGTKDRQPSSKEKRKKSGFFKRIGLALLILILIIVLPIIGLIIYSCIDSEDPARHIADGYYTVVTVMSASDTLQKGLYLNAVDSLLSSPETAALQSNIRALRSNTTLQAVWFKRLLNIPVNVALYKDNNAVIVANIGIRSAATRLLPLITAIKPDLFTKIPNFSQKSFEVNGILKDGFLFELTKDQMLYICFHKNLLIASTSPALFYAALSENSKESGKQLATLLSGRKNGAIGGGADPLRIIPDMAGKQNIVGTMIKELTFPEPATFTTDFDDKMITLHSTIAWLSERSEINAVLQRRSTLPAVLSRLPEGTEYLTLLNLGDPQFLYENTKPFFTSELTGLFANAEKNSKRFFNKTLNQLIFEWMGSELGVLGHRDAQSPVFFVSLKDEAKCRSLLEDMFNTMFLNRSVSAVVDGNRIPRIVFPSWLSALLHILRIDLPEPFYMIQDGYLYLSKSAEALGICKNETDAGKLLVKTEQWKNSAKTISAETSFLVYYSLERSVPFFLEQNALLKTALKNYGKGIVSLRFAADRQVHLDFYTQKTETHKLEEIPAFPRTGSERAGSDIICVKTASAVPFVFWANDSTVYSMNLLTGEEASLPLDGKAGIAAEVVQSQLHALWAVSARGSIYKTNERLEPFEGFPVLTAEKLQPKPVSFNGGVIVPLFSEPALLATDQHGTEFIFDKMESRLRDAPIVFKNTVVALPRSFESRLYLFSPQGTLQEGFPVELDGIFAAAPVFFEEAKGRDAVALLSEDGRFSIRSLSEGYKQTASCELTTVCKTTPVYSALERAFFAVSQNGHLFKISTGGEIIDSVPLKQGTAEDYRLTLLDVTGDGKPEILVSGGGNALYAYTSGLTPVGGFPVEGSGTPYLLDIDGDSFPELITHGIDSKIHAYKGAALR